MTLPVLHPTPPILAQVQDACPRKFDVVKDTLATRNEKDTIYDLVKDKVLFSYYATPLVNGDVPRCDIVVGFVVDTPTTFTLSVGKGMTLSKSLFEGEFQFPIGTYAFPSVASQFAPLSISDLKGSGYVIHATLNEAPRRELGLHPPFELGDYCIMSGVIIPKNMLKEYTAQGVKLYFPKNWFGQATA